MKSLTLTVILLLVSISAYDQNNLWISYPDQAFTSDVCPTTQNPYYYTALKNNDNLDGCTFKWKVTNGVIIGTSSDTGTFYEGYSNQIAIKWNNIAQKGTIKVTLYGCSIETNNSQVANASLNILSLTGVTPTAINNKTSQIVQFGSSPEFFALPISVAYPSNGKVVDSYYWTIPNGWSYNGVISNGQVFTTSTQGINVIPNPVSSGKVTVKGHTDCGFESNQQQLTITRPAITIQSPKSIIYQGDDAPITMSLSIAHASNYSYLWSKPDGWEFQGGVYNASTVTLVPNGCTGGQVTCTITSEGQSVSATPLTITSKAFPDNQVPTISGNNFLCANQPFSIINLPNNTNSIDWSINSLANVTSGQGTSNVIINPIGNSGGNAIIGVTLSVGGCTPFSIEPKYLWVGKPQITSQVPLAYYTNGVYNSVCNSQTYITNMTISGASNATWYRIAASPSNTSWYQTGNNVSFYFWSVNQTQVFRISSSNTCGTTSYDFGFKSITCGPDPCNPVYTIAPNPASDQSTVIINIPAPCDQTLMQSSSFNGYVAIYDNQGTLKKKENYKTYGNIDLDLSGLKNGVHHIEIFDGKTIHKKTILIQK